MTQPTAYSPAHDFSDEEGTTHGLHLDEEFQALKLTIDQIRQVIAFLQRDDGLLANGAVRMDALSQEVLSLLAASGATARGAWLTATAYAAKDIVSQGGATYLCVTAHTAGTFSTDLAAGKWVEINGSSASVSFTPYGNIAASNVQDAIEELDDEKQPLDATLTALAGVTTSADKVIYATGADAFSATTLTAFARQVLGCGDSAEANTVLGTTSAATIQTQSAIKFTAGGTADAMSGSLNPAITGYTSGLRVTCIPGGANTTTNPTLNLNSIGAWTIKKRDASGAKAALVAGDYNASGPFDFESDGTDFVLLNPLSLPSGALSTTFALSGDISPSQITADQNDYNPTGLSSASTLRLTSDASRNVTGLQGGADGRVLVLHNVGSNNIVLKDDSASSTAGNRFALSADITIGVDQAAVLQYDSTSSRWRCIALPAASSSSGLVGVTTFSSNGTWTKPGGCNKIVAMAVGGGGAGGGSNLTLSGFGGEAGAVNWAYTASPASSYSITIGAGGTGVSAANGNNGSATTVGALLTAAGGNGGLGIVFPYSGTAGASCSGAGGAIKATPGAGNSASANTGAGGGGAGLGANYAGGAGGSGYVIIWEFA